MRIALTCNFSPWSSYCGGAQRSTHALACSLANKGHDVTVVFTKTPREQPQPPADLPYHVRWARFIGTRSSRTAPLRPLNAFTVLAQLRQLHAERPLDAIHGQGEEAAFVNALSFRRHVRFVLTPRYPDYPCDLHPQTSLKARARHWLFDAKYPLLGIALAHADHVCPTSSASADALRRAYGHRAFGDRGDDELSLVRDELGSAQGAGQLSTTQVIPNGVSETFFDVNWQGPNDHAPLLFFGRTEADKGVDTLLCAMVGIERELIVVGRGSKSGEYRELAQRLGLRDRVQFIGWTSPEDLARLLARCGAAVLPSRAESFGNAMAECMAAGVPLVTTSVGSIPEVVGDAAVLVEPDKPLALAAAIQSLLTDDVRACKLARSGRERVLERFRWHQVASAYEQLYRGVV